MARAPSLKPQLNQIRTWVGEGVTDIWIAHQLGVTPAQIADFRRKQGLLRPDEAPTPAKARAPRPAAAAAKPRAPRAAKAEPAAATETPSAAADADEATSTDEDGTPKRRRRGRRGGRGRSKGRAQTIPATLEHGDQGLVIRIDAAILTSDAYREHWAEVTAAGITVTAEGIALSVVAATSAAGHDDDTEVDSEDAVDNGDDT
ncbi:MAG: hypothetical protein ACR2J9_04300 [Gaiellales bacterium]